MGDNEGRLSDAVRTALERSDIVLLSGGLGPTEDDITRETVAKVLGREMKEVPEIHEQIQAYFERMGAKRPSDNNWRQAMVIEGAEIVENHNGTAPGMIIPVAVSYTHLDVYKRQTVPFGILLWALAQRLTVLSARTILLSLLLPRLWQFSALPMT